MTAGIRHEVASVPSHDGVSALHMERWIPAEVASGDSDPRAIIQIVHGMVEHVGRYARFAESLADLGFVVVGEDHIGHGYTAGADGDLGHMEPGRGMTEILKDMALLAQETRMAYPGVPLIMFGHSMGSFLARAFVVDHPVLADGFILSGTAFRSQLPIKAGRSVARVIGSARGRLYRSEIIERLALGAYSTPFRPNTTPHDWISRDEAVVDAYEADELSGAKFSVGAYAEMFGLLSRICSPDHLSATPDDLPILIISGEKDPVGHMGKGPRELTRRLESCGVADVTLKLYPECRHELLNEQDREVVEQEIIAWIEQHILEPRGRADS